MVQLIHVVPESWKKNFCIFFISWWTASGTVVSAFSWHPTQENRMLTISSSGWWKVMTSVTSTLENVDNIIFFVFTLRTSVLFIIYSSCIEYFQDWFKTVQFLKEYL